MLLHANIDAGFGDLGNTEIRWKLVGGNTSWQEDDAPGPCNSNFGANCDMTNGPANVTLDQQYARHAVAIAIYRFNLPPGVIAADNLPPECGNTQRTDACAWYYPDNGGNQRGLYNPPTTAQGNANIFSHPVQRAFMGDLNKSGWVKFLHLYNVDCSTGGGRSPARSRRGRRPACRLMAPARPIAASSSRWGSRERSRATRTSLRSSSTSGLRARVRSSTATEHLEPQGRDRPGLRTEVHEERLSGHRPER